MRTRRALLIPLIATTLLVVGGIAPSASARPLSQNPSGVTIPYSGRLTGDDGQPVADGAYDMRFALYAAMDGGEPLWAETQTGVAVRGGSFGVALGSAIPITKAAMESGEGWLEVSVRGPGEAALTALAPRQQVSLATSTSPNVPPSCVHDHFDEWWTGSTGTAGLIADNRTGTGDGVRGYSNAGAADFGGVYGVNFNSGPGVYGRSDGGGPGVAGYSAWRGVYGKAPDGVVGESAADGMSGVYGFNTANGYGVTGRAGANFGVFAWGNDTGLSDAKGDILLQGNYGEIATTGDYLDIYTNANMWIDLDDDNNTPYSTFGILSGSDGALWTIQEPSGNVVAAGSQASAVQTADKGPRLMYAVEGTGVWLEDVGTAALVDGEATIAFDPVYAQAASLGQEYQVFVTALGEQFVLLQVTAKTATGFTVRGVTLDGKPATCDFDYRIVAPRLGYESVRTEQYMPQGKVLP